MLLVMLFSFTVFLFPKETLAVSDYYRIAGNDRISTAIAISEAGWDTSDTLIIARADNPADALAAASLSGKKEAPILLTYTNSLPQNVIREMRRLEVSKVFLLGGNSAISIEIEKSIKKEGYNVERISGKDRFETAANINKTANTDTYSKAILVNGYTVADAISASSTSAIEGIPIYLATDKNIPIELPKTIKEVTIYGGDKVIGNNVASQLSKKGIKVKRISGKNRFDTNIQSLNKNLTESAIIVRGTSVSSTKEDYPDAVTASGLSKVLNANVILSHPTKVVSEVEKHFSVNRYENIFVIGGENAVSSDVVWDSSAFVDSDLRQIIKEDIVDSTIHPTKPIIYYTNSKDKLIRALNYETGKVQTIEFKEKPESIYFANNKLYVALLKREHSSYWDQYQEGAIAIINSDTFKLDKKLEINLDPFDIVVDSEGFIYVAGGSGQHTSLISYNSNGKELSSKGIYQSTSIELDSSENKIYAIDTQLSPRDIFLYEISSGIITGYRDSPYHGDYPLGTKIKISPDGHYIFNNSGYVFQGSSLNYHSELDYEFSDMLFDDTLKNFYLGLNGLMFAYDYQSFRPIGALSTHGDIQTMHQNKNDMVILSEVFLADTTKLTTGVEVIKKDNFLQSNLEKKTPMKTPIINQGY